MFKSNARGLLVQVSEYGVQLGRLSRLEPPWHLEALDERPMSTPLEELREFVQDFSGAAKGQLAHAFCLVHPPHRVLRRATIESPAKAKDPAFFPEYLKNHFKLDIDVYAISALTAAEGLPFQAERGASKELVFCGAPQAELEAEQERLVKMGVFPQRLEIGTVSTVGALIEHGSAERYPAPTLVLEISGESAQVMICHQGQLDVARPIPHGLNSMYPVVQKELGLKDEQSAKRLFTSDTFDFTEMGPVLLRKLLKELQASTGFYEVQTGQTIGRLHLSLLPDNLSWIGSTLCRSLGLDELVIDLPEWASQQEITVANTLELTGRGARWFGLLSLLNNHHPEKSEAVEEAAGHA